MSYETHNGTLYDYTAGVYAGVLVKEAVMRKLVRLQQKNLEEVKRVLSDGLDNGEVFSSSWTLHYPAGEQIEVSFIDPNEDVRRRIKVATTTHQPKVCPLVFIAESMDEAKLMADARYAELGEDV